MPKPSTSNKSSLGVNIMLAIGFIIIAVAVASIMGCSTPFPRH